MKSESPQKQTKLKIDQISPFFSILIPGSGQLFQKKTWRGITIFLFALVLGFLVRWGYQTFDIGRVQVSETNAFSWLLIPLAVFYLWNILDAFLLAADRKSSTILA